MLQQDLAAHQHQNDAAGQFRTGFVAGAEPMADGNAHGRKAEGDHADEADGGHNVHRQEGKGHAHGQRVDAGGHRQGEHGGGAKLAVQLLRLGAGFTNHVSADEYQQGKGNPMIHIGDELLELGAQQITHQRHQSLEAAEVQAGDGRMTGL